MGLKVQETALPVNSYKWKIGINSMEVGCLK